MTDTQSALLAALRYLDREGTMTASDVGSFAVGDPWLFDRLRHGEDVGEAAALAAVPLVVRVLDQIIAKLAGQKEALSAMVAA